MTNQPNPLPRYAHPGDVLDEGYVYRSRTWGHKYQKIPIERQEAQWHTTYPNNGGFYTTAKKALSSNNSASTHTRKEWDTFLGCWVVYTKKWSHPTYSWELSHFLEEEAIKVKVVVE